MFVAGIDIGSAASKAVILNGQGIVGSHVVRTGPHSRAAAEEVLAGLLTKCGLAFTDLRYIVATGYGRINVPGADEVMTEIACHAKGVHTLFPGARTILDMGGQDCKAIRIDETGRHTGFAMNDKCAAGTGRFLEVMANMLNVPIEKIGPLSLEADKGITISNMCLVFARSEVGRHLRRGISRENVLAGLHEAIADRAYGLLRRVGITTEFVISGGIAKNAGIVQRMQKRVGLPAHVSADPQIIGALGAACFGLEMLLEKRNTLAREGT